MRPDETVVPPAVGSLALSPSLQGLFLCRLLYPLLRVSSSYLCPVSLSRLSVPSLSSRFLFSLFLRVSVSRPSLPVSPRLLNLSTSRFSLRLLPSPTFTLLYLFPLFVSLRSSLFTSFFHPRLFTSPLLFFPHLSSSFLTSPLLSSPLLFSPASPFAPLLPLGDAGRNRIRKIPDFIAGRFLRSVFRLRCKCSKFSVIMIS